MGKGVREAGERCAAGRREAQVAAHATGAAAKRWQSQPRGREVAAVEAAAAMVAAAAATVGRRTGAEDCALGGFGAVS